MYPFSVQTDLEAPRLLQVLDWRMHHQTLVALALYPWRAPIVPLLRIGHTFPRVEIRYI